MAEEQPAQLLAHQTSCEDEVIRVRLHAVSEAQRRTRAAFLAATIVSLAIIITCFNAYFSWYRNFVLKKDWPVSPVTAEAQKYLTEEWVKSLKVSIPMLGINVGVGDAAVLGSLSLLIISIWLFFSVRRENHTIGLLLQETQDCDAARLHMIFHGVVSYSVFTTVTKIDSPIRNLRIQNSEGSVWFVRTAFRILVLLPSVAILFLLVMDIISIFHLAAPFRESHEPLYHGGSIPDGDWPRRVAMETLGWVLLTLTTILCGNAIRYNNGTESVLREYDKLLRNKSKAEPNQHIPTPDEHGAHHPVG